ncbi:IS3 family transposase [Micromonospora sp. WMMA2032]|uniref:IS3 family transposase n=1 Tax=Micromonospora sp. WMMA2032 TaxID=2039870 RepID=UPI00352E213C
MAPGLIKHATAHRQNHARDRSDPTRFPPKVGPRPYAARQRHPALHGSVGDSFDNALMENFWPTLKIELVYRNSWRTRDEAENTIFAYIDGWYNTRRIQKDLGWRSPDEYETAWHTHQARPDETAIVQPEPTGARSTLRRTGGSSSTDRTCPTLPHRRLPRLRNQRMPARRGPTTARPDRPETRPTESALKTSPGRRRASNAGQS